MEEENVKVEEGTGASDEGVHIPEEAPGAEKKPPMGIYLVVGLVIIVALGAMLMSTKSNDDSEKTPLLQETEVVTTINGKDVPSAMIAKSVTQAEQVALQNGLDVTDEAVRAQINSQALEIAINTTLLSQAAEAAGITASKEQVDEQIALLESQFGGAEGLQEQLNSLALTNEELRMDLAVQIAVQTYLEEAPEFTGLEVSQVEIEDAYAAYLLENPELPSLDEIGTQIEELLLGQKQQEASSLLIERLRAEAVIETQT